MKVKLLFTGNKGNTLVYTLAAFLNKGIPFLLLPYLTNHLLPADYGVLAMFQIIVSFLEPIFCWGGQSAVQREFFYNKEGSYSRYIYYLFLIILSNGVLFLLIAQGIKFFFDQILGFPVDWLWSIIVVVCFNLFFNTTLSYWQNSKKPYLFSGFSISNTILNISTSILLISIYEFDWIGRLYGYLISATFLGLLSVLFIIKNNLISFSFRKSEFLNLMRFGLPMIPHAFGSRLIMFSDRIIILQFLTLKEVGIYFVSYQIGQILYVFNDAFNKAWLPWFYSNINKNEASDRKIIKVSYTYMAFLLLLSLFIWGISDLIFKYIIGPEFIDANKLLIWFLLGFSFNGMGKLITGYFLNFKDTKFLAINSFGSGVLNIILNLIFLPILGLKGAAIATCSSFLIGFLFLFFISYKRYNMPWFTTKII